MKEPIIQAKNIVKIFPGVVALDHVSFDLVPGEVHILVGENGAGKSTLSKVLLGAYIPEEGQLYFEGEKVSFSSAKDALDLGMAAVYQEFTLVPYLNVASNIFINREPKTKLGLVDHKKMHRDAKAILETLNSSNIDTHAMAKSLSIAQQQMVEIAKALSYKPKVIIFDEPTATLSRREVDSLFEQIRHLKEQGIGIVYVSHRMQEFKKIGDRITVLRDGKKIATVSVNECDDEELVRMMIGRDLDQTFSREEHEAGEVYLETKNLNDSVGFIKNVSIKVRRGEIVGLSGLVGSGRTEIAKLLFGIDPIGSGTIKIEDKEVKPKNPTMMIKKGIGLVCEDRKKFGLHVSDSISDNIVSASLIKYFPHRVIHDKKITNLAEDYRGKLNIASPDVKKKCKLLSGGNQQKVVLGKWLAANSELFIFDEPTRGIDVGAKFEIYSLMSELSKQGKAILMISSDLPEIIGMSDRIYVMREGQIVSHFDRKDFSQESIGFAMMGVQDEKLA